ncbi:hypothetical protein pdam_00021323, partial [Pocillopora damicornis]
MAAKVVQDEKSTKKVVVVGGGLAGALIAVYLAKRGFKVDVFEARKGDFQVQYWKEGGADVCLVCHSLLNPFNPKISPIFKDMSFGCLDPRKEVAQRGRSVNLALSVRGIESLRAVGAEGLVMALGIPMHARMIHSHSGNTTPIPYGKKGQHLLSVERQKLNNDLLTVAETYPDVRIHFEHKLIAADIEGGHLTFNKGNDDEKLEVDADIILGCDGAYSALRRELMRRPRFDFSQEYIPHGYKELCLAPTKDGEFAMAVNYLHIWPRQTFMMIALPNQDDVLTFFNAEFPDFLNLMGEEKLLEEFFRNPTGPMVSIK